MPRLAPAVAAAASLGAAARYGKGLEDLCADGASLGGTAIEPAP